MAERRRYNVRKILTTTIWMLWGIGTMVLLGAAIYKKDKNYCKDVQITIHGVKDYFFIDKNDVNAMLEKMNFGNLRVSPLNTFDLAGMEAFLKKNEWIKSAELYFDNNDVLRINIMEREPVVRIFTTAGSSFYIDSSLKKLSLSPKVSPRLPVFTSFPDAGSISSNKDSSLLTDIRNVATYIARDPFWMAQVEQVDIKPDGSFEMIPKIGNQLIIFGSAENFREKFNHLLLFYTNVQSKVGWNKYATINVSYKDQVVAIKRGAGDIKSDSLKTIQLIKALVANAQKQANDSSTNNVQLVQPKEDNVVPYAKSYDESFTDVQEMFSDSLSLKPVNTFVPANDKPSSKTPGTSEVNGGSITQFPILKPIPTVKPGPSVKKRSATRVIKKPGVEHKQPKAVMQPKNDY